ncbi:hypothetical protein C8R45DRAFT_942526 [Mycena sanguinolenta]|nr:hypothetical protein C8R45DRAFT_942526 [Mycena sanguinolenta]
MEIFKAVMPLWFPSSKKASKLHLVEPYTPPPLPTVSFIRFSAQPVEELSAQELQPVLVEKPGKLWVQIPSSPPAAKLSPTTTAYYPTASRPVKSPTGLSTTQSLHPHLPRVLPPRKLCQRTVQIPWTPGTKAYPRLVNALQCSLQDPPSVIKNYLGDLRGHKPPPLQKRGLRISTAHDQCSYYGKLRQDWDMWPNWPDFPCWRVDTCKGPQSIRGCPEEAELECPQVRPVAGSKTFQGSKLTNADTASTPTRPGSSWPVSVCIVYLGPGKGICLSNQSEETKLPDSYPPIISRPDFGKGYMLASAEDIPKAIHIKEHLMLIDRVNILHGGIKKIAENMIPDFYKLTGITPAKAKETVEDPVKDHRYIFPTDPTTTRLKMELPFHHGCGTIRRSSRFSSVEFSPANARQETSTSSSPPVKSTHGNSSSPM